MKAAAGLLLLAVACVEPALHPGPPATDVSFWVRLRQGSLVGTPIGPIWDQAGAETFFPSAVDEELRWIGLPTAQLSSRLQADPDRLASSLALGPGSPEISACEAEGRQEGSRIDVALAELEHQSLVLDRASGSLRAAESSVDLALSFERGACPDGRELSLRPFMSSLEAPICAGNHCAFQRMHMLDADTVIASTETFTMVLGRGQPAPGLEAGVALASLLSIYPGKTWVVEDLLSFEGDWPRAPGRVVAALSLHAPSAVAAGAALISMTVETNLRLSAMRVEFERVVSDNQERELSFLALERNPDGGYFAFGAGLVAIATSADSPVDVREERGFLASHSVPLPEDPTRFLAVATGRQLYEGDPRQALVADDVYSLMGMGVGTIYGLTTLSVDGQNRLIIGTGSGEFWQRIGPRQWRPFAAQLSPSGEICKGPLSPCGHARPGRDLANLLPLGPGGTHLGFGIVDCNALFVRFPNDPCSYALPLNAGTIQLGPDVGVKGSAALGSTVVFSTPGLSGPAVYEVVFAP